MQNTNAIIIGKELPSPDKLKATFCITEYLLIMKPMAITITRNVKNLKKYPAVLLIELKYQVTPPIKIKIPIIGSLSVL